MKIIKRIEEALSSLTERTGKALSWLVYAMMIMTCLTVLLRYGFDYSPIALQESITYLHATVFMLGTAFTLKHGGHVRVDIFYRGFSTKHKALVDLVGTLLFLIPLCVFILLISWGYVSNSWAITERSVEASGIPAVFLLKSLIPLMAVLLLLQAVAEAIKNGLVLVAENNSDGDNEQKIEQANQEGAQS